MTELENQLVCNFKDQDGPCWGEVALIDQWPLGNGKWQTIHACEGHRDCPDGSYCAQPTDTKETTD